MGSGRVNCSALEGCPRNKIDKYRSITTKGKVKGGGKRGGKGRQTRSRQRWDEKRDGLGERRKQKCATAKGRQGKTRDEAKSPHEKKKRTFVGRKKKAGARKEIVHGDKRDREMKGAAWVASAAHRVPVAEKFTQHLKKGRKLRGRKNRPKKRKWKVAQQDRKRGLGLKVRHRWGGHRKKNQQKTPHRRTLLESQSRDSPNRGERERIGNDPERGKGRVRRRFRG